MSDESYAWIYEDPFHFYFSICTTTLSICSNGLLLYILYATRIGPYAYLLAVFSVCDLLTSCAHATFRPILHMTHGGFYFFPRHGKILIAGKSFDTIFALIFIATYYQTFLVLAYHFVYRYKIVSRGMYVSNTNKLKRKHWAVLGVLINILYISGLVLIAARFTPSEETREIVPKEIVEIYGIDLTTRPCHRAAASSLSFHFRNIRNDRNVSRHCHRDYLLHVADEYHHQARYMKSSVDQLAAKTRQIQMALFKSLLIQATSLYLLDQFECDFLQTAIPVVFSYAPLSIILLFPAVTGISLGAFGNVLFTITSIFPSIDAFVVLFFIRVLRMRVIRLFRITIYVNDASMADATANFKTVISESKSKPARF